MSQEGPPEGNGQGGEDVIEEEFVGSDKVTRNTRIISQNLVEILTDTDAAQWDDGWVMLADGYQFNLWSHINPEPVERQGETMDAFIVRQRQARLDRLTLLANRARRTGDAQLAHEEAFPTPPHPVPPRLSSPDAAADADDRRKKQVLLNRLANRVAEDITDPLDKTMFEYLDRIEAEAARAAFQKVLNSPNGMAVLTDQERTNMTSWKSKSEFKTQKRAEEAARTLGVYSNLYSSDSPRPVDTPPRVTPIRVTCPRYNPASDPIGSLATWLAGVQNFHSLQRITDLEDKKRVLFSSVDITAQFRLGERLLPTSPFVEGLTYDEYVEQIRLIFSPPSESTLWKSDYKNYRQARGMTVVDYLQKKGQLFQLGYRESLDSQHFIEEAIVNIFHSKVKQEIYRAAPATFADLVTVSQKAVGLIRLMEAPSQPQAIGLASITHPVSLTSTSASSSRNSSLVGEMMEAGVGDEEDDEGFVEPLTIEQMDFCLFNESDEESIFWENQPDGSEDFDSGTVGEMVGAPQNSPASPEGPCWVCGGPHVKRNCPARLKAVHAKVGRTSRPSRGGRGGRPYQRFEEVRRGSSRRGRPPFRSRPSASSSGRSAISDSRRGIFPVRERRVGEISDTGHEGELSPPEEGNEGNQEVGGLYNAHYDQYDHDQYDQYEQSNF